MPISQRTLFACEPRRNRTATHHQQLNSHNTMNGVQPLGSVSFFSASKPTTISQIIARREKIKHRTLSNYLDICIFAVTSCATRSVTRCKGKHFT
nr:MAG TPA: putative periplasmic protein [Caudoviricetes sp.]